MSENGKVSKALFSPLIRRSSAADKIAYVAILTALSVVANSFLEFKFLDNQYSFTIFFSTITGVFLGPILGFFACFLGDVIGYFINSSGLIYMPWVGLSTGFFALLAGFILGNVSEKKPKIIVIRILIFCILSFLICTIGINSTGFYFFNKSKGFSPTVMNYFTTRFGGNATFFAYVAYRMFFKLQILNSLFNYALIFVFLPLLFSVKGLRPYL